MNSSFELVSYFAKKKMEGYFNWLILIFFVSTSTLDDIFEYDIFCEMVLLSSFWLQTIWSLLFESCKFFDSKVDTQKSDSIWCMGKGGHYYNVYSISGVVFVDKQRNDNNIIIFSIKLFGKDNNDGKLFKQLTTIVPHDWNYNLFALYLCEVVMKKGNALFVYLNPTRMIR